MPAPTTVEAFLEMGYRSGLLEKAAVESLQNSLNGHSPATPAEFAATMVEHGLLTQFQAQKLLSGRWRGFVIAQKYRLLERLGAGGMGAVYLCEHILMDRRVALKILPTHQAEDPACLARFYREARAVARLDHPNIVRAHDIDRDDKLHFIVLEYVDGCNLHEFVYRNGVLSPLRAAHYIRQAALGLQHAHEAGLVHRDIKPGNLLLDRQGVVKILDMGLARFFHEDGGAFVNEYENGFVIGTADFVAPEQVVDSQVDIRADIYSLGGTLYYLLVGKCPFQDGTNAQKLIWHQVRQPKPVTRFRSDVPHDLLAILDKMMAKEPCRRYQTPAEVAAALAPLTKEPCPPPSPEEMPRPAVTVTGKPSSQISSGRVWSSAAKVRLADEPSANTTKERTNSIKRP
ncbi:MAG: serine/threonine protein kinase [Gemmataceae bacterium]|nr:serine/threonine protein kinase [Gemmataceae bacterium]